MGHLVFFVARFWLEIESSLRSSEEWSLTKNQVLYPYRSTRLIKFSEVSAGLSGCLTLFQCCNQCNQSNGRSNHSGLRSCESWKAIGTNNVEGEEGIVENIDKPEKRPEQRAKLRQNTVENCLPPSLLPPSRSSEDLDTSSWGWGGGGGGSTRARAIRSRAIIEPNLFLDF